MSDYEAIRTEAPPALEDFPSIEDTGAVIRQVNRLFDPYVFFERHKDSIELWCSCCLRHGEIDIPPRTVTTVEYELLYNKHNEHVSCPYCGARATYKNARKLGKKTRLPQYLPVVLLAEKDGDLYARAYWTRKTYATLDGAPEFYLVEGYHFTPGMATIYAQSYSGFEPHSVSSSYDPVHRVVTEPFTEGSYYWFRYKPYVVLGLDAIGKSTFRYCGYESFERGIDAVWGLETVRTRYDMMKFFAAASIYPRQIEMLLKTNCGGLVDDLVLGRKKNKDIFDWSKDNYLEAFGLSKTEMRAWRESGAELEAIAWYRRLRRAGLSESFETIKYLDEMCPYTFPMKDFVRLCCRARVKPARLAAYLSQGQKAIPENEIQTYKDYLDMAKALGWDMKNDTVKLPKNLHRRHDEAVIEINIKLANEGIKLADDSIIKRRAKYNFEMGDYLIRCAVSANEIIREGKSLQHCVGGYAQRHMTGALTICFLRRRDAPHKSLYTIEMQGNRLMQIHGFRNDRNAANPRTTMAWMIKPWLDWIAKGSKRDKDGKPRLPKKKEAKTA